jgi:hypothetical protein
VPDEDELENPEWNVKKPERGESRVPQRKRATTETSELDFDELDAR